MKFKVGDRVAVYHDGYGLATAGPKRNAGEVIEISASDQILGVRIDGIHSNEEYGDFHPKQCRRLVKKPRRKVWLQENQNGELMQVWYDSPEGAKRYSSSGYRVLTFVEERNKK